LTVLDVTAAEEHAEQGLAHWTRLLCVLFFFSGFPALIYQLTWQRALFRTFGVNIESVTIVVTAFMLGLGIGSLAGGWLSKRRLPLLPLLAVIEVMTAAFGLFSLAIFDRVGELAAPLSLTATAAVTLTLVLVPTLLMGATLPILVGHLVRRSPNVGSAVGLLYYVNTLGAGVACFVAIILVFPFLGMQGAVNLAVALNVAVAAGALAAHVSDRRNPALAAADAAPAIAPAEKPVLGFIPVLALACAGGFVSLSYEIFFFRTMSYATGSSATAFGATLGAFLIGLASGSRQAGRSCSESDDDPVARVVLEVTIANLVGCLFLPVLGLLSWAGGSVVGLGLLMVYLVARFWGSFLPNLAALGIAADAGAGMRTALLYLANILGAAAGSIITGFVLMDVLTLTGIAGWLVLIGLLTAIAVFTVVPVASQRKNTLATGAAALGLITVLANPVLNADILERLAPKGFERDTFVNLVENRSGIVTVDRAGTVFGNGMYDGRVSTDLVKDNNGIVRPYALSLFHPAPRHVLMIGFSSGSWAQVIASNPAVRTLTIVEINPGYVTLAAEAPEVASVLDNPKVTIITDDGRRWLKRNGRKFDAIVSNTTWHFRANVTNLLSAEFLALVNEHLKPGGIFFYNTTGSDRVLRTGCAAFPHGARFVNHLVVSASPIEWDFQRWQRVLAAYLIDGKPALDLGRAPDQAVLEQLMAWEASLVLGADQGPERPIETCRDILARTEGRTIVTDDNMGSEWRNFLGLE
jgi:spermidine synthase